MLSFRVYCVYCVLQTLKAFIIYFCKFFYLVILIKNKQIWFSLNPLCRSLLRVRTFKYCQILSVWDLFYILLLRIERERQSEIFFINDSRQWWRYLRRRETVNNICTPSSTTAYRRRRGSYSHVWRRCFWSLHRNRLRVGVVAVWVREGAQPPSTPDHQAHSCFRIKYTNLKPIARPRCIKIYYYYFFLQTIPTVRFALL